MKNPPWLSDNLQSQLGQIFADELREYTWSAELAPFYSRLQTTNSLIFEKLDGKQSFSDALWNICFPRLPSGEFWHHTDLENLESILQSAEIWLHPVEKRLKEGELVEFASTFNYRGFFATDNEGGRLVDKLSEDLFFLSLTSEEGPSELQNYGEVRLRFRVAPVLARAELRCMKYAVGNDHPLLVLDGIAQKRFNRRFLPWGVSRLASFLLDPYYSWEKEVRLLIKRFAETTDLTIKQSGKYDAVAIPIGLANSRVSIDLIRIEVDTPQSLECVKNLLATSPLKSIPVQIQC